MTNRCRSKILPNGLALLLTGTMLFAAGCNTGDRSGLRVAHGEDDVKKAYPGTVYVEMRGTALNGTGEKIIRNVGTITDVGLKNSYALILSLADVFERSDNKAQLPIFKTMTMKLYQGAESSPIAFPVVQMTRDGYLEDTAKQNKFKMFIVGLKVQGNSDAASDKTVREYAQKISMESPLMTEQGINLRDAYTSFIMLSIPKNHPSIAGIKVPVLMTAESLPALSALKGVVVGYGETAVGTIKKGGFSLSSELPGIRGRNFASIEALTDTPLRKLIGNTKSTSEQIWEFSGSGLCRSNALPQDGAKSSPNYDTGAAVYIDGQFAGFGVRSTAKSTGYKDILNCQETSAEDMATQVVSISASHVAAFRAQVGE